MQEVPSLSELYVSLNGWKPITNNFAQPLKHTQHSTMAKTVGSSSDQLQIQNKLDTSLALQPMDNIPEERIDSSENQGNNVDLENFDRGNDNGSVVPLFRVQVRD